METQRSLRGKVRFGLRHVPRTSLWSLSSPRRDVVAAVPLRRALRCDARSHAFESPASSGVSGVSGFMRAFRLQRCPGLSPYDVVDLAAVPDLPLRLTAF